MTPILIHSDAVPLTVREALKAVGSALPEQRDADLARAASLLYRETALDCRDARELLGLSGAAACG